MPKRSAAYMDDRRNAILDAADACLDRGGMERVSTTAICKEAGISMGALYTHFPTKEDILFALAQRRASERRSLYSFGTATEMRESIGALFDQWLCRRDSLRGEFELLIERSRGPELGHLIQQVRTSKELSAALGRLVKSGALPASYDVDAAAEAIEATMLGLAFSVLIGKVSEDEARSALAVSLASLSGEN